LNQRWNIHFVVKSTSIQRCFNVVRLMGLLSFLILQFFLILLIIIIIIILLLLIFLLLLSLLS
jgi:hypothetical protein